MSEELKPENRALVEAVLNWPSITTVDGGLKLTCWARLNRLLDAARAEGLSLRSPTALTDAQRELLEDKFVLWDRASREGAMDLRDYNRRAAEALKVALGICAERGV
jgi:hypothetical protein